MTHPLDNPVWGSLSGPHADPGDPAHDLPAASNETAIRLYLSLGFELRRTVSFTSVRRASD